MIESRRHELALRENDALRRMAVLVAHGPPPEEVFEAVTREAAELLGAQRSTLLRVDSPQRATVVAGWSRDGAPQVPAGHHAAIDERGILGRMLKSPRPLRVEDFDAVGEGVVAALMRRLEIRSAAAGPIILDGRLWGALTASWPADAVMPAGAEDQVAAFAELVSLAIENAEVRRELAASRARLVTAADEARRRIERDLHDGAQQRLVVASLRLSILERKITGDPDEALTVLASARDDLDGGLAELRDLAHGIHPAVLTEQGLASALQVLAERAAAPVDLRCAVPPELDAVIESTVYFFVSEALTNIAKYANANAVSVEVAATGSSLVASVSDDGIGGADPAKGSGLRGMADRIEAVGGQLQVTSAPGAGTHLRAELPLRVLGSADAE